MDTMNTNSRRLEESKKKAVEEQKKLVLPSSLINTA
jgi:hypothetical protein